MGIIRKLLAWLSVPIICFFALIPYLARPFNPDNNRLLGRTVARFGRWILGMERPLQGMENMPTDRPTVVIANHQHNDDLFVLADLLPKRGVVAGKSSLVWIPFFGQVFWLGGNVILNRSRSHKAVALMKTTSEAIARDRKSFWVFPEGTRSKGRGLLPFKKGAFHAAIASGAPITMICAAHYEDKTIGWTGRRETVPVRILPPIETSELNTSNLPELMNKCHRLMAEAIADLDKNAKP
ncbi:MULTISPECIES: 1-acylglycerol-3-phosphate O-acyltransferase [Marinobacter]|uniref:1-acyl-sn-glycerol-3-phosphate acyltransferase n=1 Tax=Marinobacter suaedae TaxID=3057675 RepID=A0ABT8VYX2_9GAMM|nr:MULTISPECIES: 1-acylglycerol-3-phosphate O-acyltransferase [unclassified Marinobacter]MBZ2169323.1 1-acylglycerol-3-phosphate O-acyltransferase [Marinobacter sp. F4216]MDO3721194.1 1-acylglycerol-3-phosphate O-acyltransferase [Marinobacter sp. chi1]